MATHRENDDESTPRAQDLALNLLGLCTQGRFHPVSWRVESIGMRVVVEGLRAAGVSESAARSSVNRLVSRGILRRVREGRTSSYSLTSEGESTLLQGRARLFSAHPFDHADDTWTILHCAIPERLRTLRYQIYSRLEWSGFGEVASGMWIAPGRIDIEELLGDLSSEPGPTWLQAFHGAPAAPSTGARLAESAWDLTSLRAQHLAFIERWAPARTHPHDALASLLLLIGDWGRLLRTDPGLPGQELDATWPSARSSQTFQDAEHRWGPAADAVLARLLEG